MSSLFGIGGGGNVGASGSFYDYSIDQSLRLDDASGAKLTISSASPTATNRKKVAISCWVKRATLGAAVHTIFHGTGNGLMMQLGPTGADEIYLYQSPWQIYKDALLIRDVGGWYHFALILDSTQATDSNRAKLYINGELQDFSTWQVGAGAARYPALNVDFTWHTGTTMVIGSTGGADDLAGYLSEFVSVDGQASSISDFAEDKNGVWVPVDTTGLTLGNAGFHLDFANSADIGNDIGANNIDFTATNLAASDVVNDSPTDNAVTWNYNNRRGVTLSEGNLYFNVGTTQGVCATMPTATTGKWYFELKVNGAIGPYNPIVWGFSSQEKQTFANYTTNPRDAETSTLSAYTDSSTWQVQAKESGTLTTISPPTAQRPAQNSIIGLAYDADTGKAWLAVNNVWIDSSGGTTGDPSTGANPTHTFTAGIAIFPAAFDVGGVQPQGILQADDDVLTYTPPTDFLTIKSSNMPEPAIGPNSTEQADDYFNTVLYTGNGSTQSVTGAGFQPDWVWLKARNFASGHALFDSVRGATEYLASESTAAESTLSTTLTSFDSDGFSLGANNGVNRNTTSFVSWNWKAGGTAVSNTDGSITSQVSAAPDAGFSICTYTGTSTVSESFGHGLNQAPELVITKARNTTNDWRVHGSVLGTDKFLSLSGTGSVGTDSANGGFPDNTDTLVNLGYESTNGTNYVAYCFHSVPGYQSVGSYVGNGNADGTFVYTGFRPAWVMVKRSSAAGGWHIFDNKRPNAFNVIDKRLEADNADDENSTSGCEIDFVSNGIKFRGNFDNINGSGSTYIYLAFAKMPFKYSPAR